MSDALGVELLSRQDVQKLRIEELERRLLAAEEYLAAIASRPIARTDEELSTFIRSEVETIKKELEDAAKPSDDERTESGEGEGEKGTEDTSTPPEDTDTPTPSDISEVPPKRDHFLHRKLTFPGRREG